MCVCMCVCVYVYLRARAHLQVWEKDAHVCEELRTELIVLYHLYDVWINIKKNVKNVLKKYIEILNYLENENLNINLIVKSKVNSRCSYARLIIPNFKPNFFFCNNITLPCFANFDVKQFQKGQMTFKPV